MTSCLSCGLSTAEVVVYTSLDQPFSEPVLQEYSRRAGVRVRPVYDVEAAKTTGLVNRLMAEKSRPQADVFWNSEVVRTVLLKRRGILAAYHSPNADGIPATFRDPDAYWTGFAARARILLVNNHLVPEGTEPRSILELAAARWKNRAALAYPLFGTASAHMAALSLALGDEKAREYLRALKRNGVMIVDGNAAARDRVVAGDVAAAFTDTDDAQVAIQSGKPVRMIYPDQDGIGALLIPNTAALIAGAPHPEEGKKLIDYLLSAEVEERLAAMESSQMPLHPGVKAPARVRPVSSIRAMQVDYNMLADKLDETMKFVQEIFVR